LNDGVKRPAGLAAEMLYRIGRKSCKSASRDCHDFKQLARALHVQRVPGAIKAAARLERLASNRSTNNLQLINIISTKGIAMSVNKISSILAPLLLTAAVAPSLAADAIAPLHPLAQRYLGETLILHIEGELTVPMVLHRNGTVSYVDIHLEKNGLADSYVRTVPFEVRDNKILCILKETQPCFDIMELNVAEPKPVNIVEYDKDKVVWSGKGQLMLMTQK
jgi:hypothetical protein